MTENKNIALLLWNRLLEEKKIPPQIWGLLMIVGGLIYLASGFYIVKTDEMGVAKLFGKIVAENVPPGVHYNIPSPFGKVHTPQTTQIKRISVGGGRNPVSGKDFYDKNEVLTGDTNILNFQMSVQYTLKTPADYLFKTESPDQIVEKVIESVITQIMGNVGVDEVLTTGKFGIQEQAKQQIQSLLDTYQTGIKVIATNLQSIEPPAEVIQTFNDVSSAKIDRQRLIDEAEGRKNELLPTARGEAYKITETAKAYHSEIINRAKGEAEKFQKTLAAYKKAGDITETRLYLETMESLLPKLRKIIVDSNEGKTPTNLKFFSEE